MRFRPNSVRGYLAWRVFDRARFGEILPGGCAAFEFSGICTGWLFLALLRCACPPPTQLVFRVCGFIVLPGTLNYNSHQLVPGAHFCLHCQYAPPVDASFSNWPHNRMAARTDTENIRCRKVSAPLRRRWLVMP